MAKYPLCTIPKREILDCERYGEDRNLRTSRHSMHAAKRRQDDKPRREVKKP